MCSDAERQARDGLGASPSGDEELCGEAALQLAYALNAETIRLEARAAELASQGLDEEARETTERARATKTAAIQAALRSRLEGPVVRIGPTYAGGVTTQVRVTRERRPAVRRVRRPSPVRARRMVRRTMRPRRRRGGLVRGGRSPGRLSGGEDPVADGPRRAVPAARTAGVIDIGGTR